MFSQNVPYGQYKLSLIKQTASTKLLTFGTEYTIKAGDRWERVNFRCWGAGVKEDSERFSEKK